MNNGHVKFKIVCLQINKKLKTSCGLYSVLFEVFSITFYFKINFRNFFLFTKLIKHE